MNPSEAALALGLASTVDNRQVGEANARVWADLMPDLELSDVQAAIKHHFATSSEYLMPHHVINHVKVLRSERARVVNVPPFPHELASNPKAEQAWKRAYCDDLFRGSAPWEALNTANGALNITPEIEPLAIGAGEDKMAAMVAAMRRAVIETARLQSLIRQENEARAADFAEKKRRYRESVEAHERAVTPATNNPPTEKEV